MFSCWKMAEKLAAASINYTISADGITGELTDTLIFIDKTSLALAPNKNYLNYDLELSHTNYLTCKLLDPLYHHT